MIEPCTWSEARPALGETLEPAAAALDVEVREGRAHPWKVLDGRLYMLTRVEHTDHGPELVIIACKGRDLTEAIEAIKARATQLGIASVRFHTAHGDAFTRLAARYGFREVERIHRVNLR